MDTAEARMARVFILLIALYFAAHTVLRTALGGSFEVDEAEMLVMAQKFQLGYGPQLPLYNWMQAAVFKVFGAGTFAITALKNTLLFATYALMFAGLRRVLPLRLAVVGTLAMLLLPNLSWEGQRAGSHTIAMLAAMSATWAVFAQILRGARGRDFWLLGLVLALGGLAKYNFWLFPLSLYVAAFSMPAYRAQMRDRRFLLALGVALALVALPYWWMMQHPDQVLSSTWKFYDDDPEVPALPWLSGLIELVGESFAAIALPLLVILVLRAFERRRFLRCGSPPAPVILLMRVALIGLAVIIAAVIIGNVSDIQPRWLLPVYIPLSIGSLVWSAQGISLRSIRNLFRFCGVLALLIVVAMADIRLRGAGSDSLEVGVLAARIEQSLGGEAPAVIGNYYMGGNLKYQRPAWVVLPPLPNAAPPPGTQVLVIIDPGNPDQIARTLAYHGISDAGDIRIQRATIPYRFEDVKTRDVGFAIVRLPG